MSSNVDELLLEHFGTKGMQWGVRKSRSQVKVSSDFKKTKPLRNRKPSTLTNKQLKEVTNRINLEKNYSRLHPGPSAKGKAVVTTILGLAGTAAAIYNLQHNPAVKAFVSTGEKRVAALIAKKAMKIPYKQLTLF